MRKAPGVLDRTAAAVAAGGMLGAAAGGDDSRRRHGRNDGRGRRRRSHGRDHMAVKQHLETVREQEQLKSQLATQQTEIAHLLAKRSSLQKCADNEIPLANCKINDTIAAASDSSKPAGDPSYETEQPQFELQKQIQEQQGYIQKLRDQVFELQKQMGGYSPILRRSGTHPICLHAMSADPNTSGGRLMPVRFHVRKFLEFLAPAFA